MISLLLLPIVILSAAAPAVDDLSDSDNTTICSSVTFPGSIISVSNISEDLFYGNVKNQSENARSLSVNAKNQSDNVLNDSDNQLKKTIDLKSYREAEETIGNPESTLYDEEAFCEVMKAALNAGILEEADRMRAEYRLEIASKNRTGTKATDFRILTREGDTSSLNEINSGNLPILLIFYDPLCSHCVETIDALKNSDVTDRLKVVAVYAEEERDIWEESKDSLPADWTVGFALDPIQEEETYIFITSPTLYLLAPDKTILLKDTTLSKIIEAKKRCLP